MRNPLVSYILSAVERYGIDQRDLLVIWRGAQSLPESRQPGPDDLPNLFRAMARMRPDDTDLGLHVGECLPLRAFNPVIYLALSSSSLANSIGATIRFAELLEGRASKLWTRPRGSVQIIGWGNLSPDEEDRHHHEFVAMGLVKAFEFLRDERISLTAVRFHHDHPGDISEHVRLFGCEPSFGHPDHSAVLIPTEVWSGKTAHADAEVARMHEAMLETAQNRLRDSQVEQRVRQAVKAGLERRATLSEVARSLAMSDRSLQRRLREAGTTYRQVVDDVRRETCMEALKNSDASVEAIALMAGFNDASSLHKAFARWTGTTPSSWRERN